MINLFSIVVSLASLLALKKAGQVLNYQFFGLTPIENSVAGCRTNKII